MKVVLRKTKDSIGETKLRELAGNLWRSLSVLPKYQIFAVANGEVLPQDSFIKKRWQPVVKNLRKIMAMEEGFPPIEMVYHEIHQDVFCFMNRKMESEAFRMKPVSKIPRLVYWELVKRMTDRLPEANKRRLEVHFDENFQGYQSSVDPRELNPQCMLFGGEFYILIDGIAEDVGVSSQTLRNWEKKGLVRFTHVPYKSIVKRIPFLRGVPYDDLSHFLEQIRQIQLARFPSSGYVPSDEACKKLNIHHTTLKRWRDSGKVKYEHKGNKFFYKA